MLGGQIIFDRLGGGQGCRVGCFGSGDDAASGMFSVGDSRTFLSREMPLGRARTVGVGDWKWWWTARRWRNRVRVGG